jgi:capsule polysaccharide export protein KpsE/RkpR
MAEIINLRRARKAKAKSQSETKADANRVAFGRTKAEKQATAAVKSLEARRLEGHKRTTDDE